MEYINLKPTQGKRKLEQHFNDLFRNKAFKGLWNRMIKLTQQTLDEKTIVNSKINKIYIQLEKNENKRSKLIQELKSANNSTINKINKIKDILAEKYGVTESILTYSYSRFDSKNSSSKNTDQFPNDLNNMCSLQDNYDEYINPIKRPDIYALRDPRFDKYKQWHVMAYPISIDLHRLVSKRDVLDYINKNWVIIENNLNIYRINKKIIRQRKISRDISDYIWLSRGKSIKVIKELIDKKFPKSGIVYYDIQKIISLEYKRRNSDSTI